MNDELEALRNRVAVLEAERDRLFLVAHCLAQAVELSRPYKDDCPLHNMDYRCCPPECLVNIAVKNYRALLLPKDQP